MSRMLSKMSSEMILVVTAKSNLEINGGRSTIPLVGESVTNSLGIATWSVMTEIASSKQLVFSICRANVTDCSMAAITYEARD